MLMVMGMLMEDGRRDGGGDVDVERKDDENDGCLHVV